MAKPISKPAAVIDIGSSAVRMLVSQWNGKGVEHLDYLEKPVPLGQEVFSSGYINFDTVRELSDILSGFQALAGEYGAGRLTATATTALREAVNQAHVLDHIRVQNGLQVQVMEDAETGALLFHYLCREMKNGAGTALLVHGGTGTVDFSVQAAGRTVYTHGMHTGLLKIADLLREAAEQSLHIDRVAMEFLQTFLERQVYLQELSSIDTLLFSMAELGPLLTLCGCEEKPRSSLSAKKINEAYEALRDLSFGQLAQHSGLGEDAVGTAYAALLLLHALCRATGVKKVRCAQCSLTDALVDLMLRPGARRQYTEALHAGTVASALGLCGRYRCNQAHARHVAAMALTLFDKLRKLHGLSKRNSLYLQAACILHELGRSTNAVDPQEATFLMIKETQLYGLRAEESLLVANIVAPQSLLGTERGTARGSALPEQSVLIAAKMHALLHLADALDFSHKQKATLTQVDLEGGAYLTLKIQVQEDYTLERLLFKQSADLFREVFGITPVLEVEDTHRMKGTV